MTNTNHKRSIQLQQKGNEMNKKRLLKLADLLEADAKNKKGIKFDLGLFGEVGDQGNPLSCGTTACALGLAALSGAFKRQGMSFEIEEEGCLVPKFGKATDFKAGAKLFDIEQQTSVWLFHPAYYFGPTEGAAGERAVAKRIRNFVAGKEVPPPSGF